jgi:hypothetical protein
LPLLVLVAVEAALCADVLRGLPAKDHRLRLMAHDREAAILIHEPREQVAGDHVLLDRVVFGAARQPHDDSS